jgi:porin
LGAQGVVSAAEEDTSKPEDSAFVRFCKRDYLLGDWGGVRTRLKEQGVDFEFVYFGAVPSNVGGGVKEGSVYEGALMMLLDLDSSKLLGYEGGQLHAAGLSIHNGPEFSANYVGDLNKVSLLDFPDNLNLWELWYEQKFLNDKISFKFGQLVVDRDFILPEFYNSLAGISFLNQTFFFPTLAFNVWDQPYFPVGHHALASTPYGTPGARLRVDPVPFAYFQVGAYSGTVDRTRGDIGFPISEDSGALIYMETGVKLNQSKEADGPPGNLKLGGYYHTDDFYDMYEGSWVALDNYAIAHGQPPLGVYSTARTHSGNYGVYFLADQTLWREVGKEDPAQQGLVGFFRVAGAPADRNLASFGIDGGLVYKGLIPSRDWDTLSLGLSYLEISDDLRHAQRDINGLVTSFGFPAPFAKLADYEAVIELNYKAQLTAWMTLQTSVQRVFHPGGRVLQDLPDAWAVIVQAAFRL